MNNAAGSHNNIVANDASTRHDNSCTKPNIPSDGSPEIHMAEILKDSP
jgi:hypothetical protein